MLGAAILFVVLAPSQATVPGVPGLARPQGPVPFRGDRLELDGKSFRIALRGNVIIRSDNLLLCCERFDGQADSQWQWQTLHCVGDVRGFIDGRWLWGDEGTYLTGPGLLEVRGRPLLKQGESWFTGAALTVEVPTQRVSLTRPRGVLDRTPVGVPPALSAELPARCPLPARTPTASSADGASER